MKTDTAGDLAHERGGSARALAGVRLLRREDDDYPTLLRPVAIAPASLHVRGTIRAEDALAVAVVGSRRATPYGIEMAEELAADLARRGVTVVSGLARGIDSAAHRGALRAGGRTIAVLGSGIDVIYPPENRRLAAEVAGSGAVVSEFPPGTPPFPQHFPQRNRLIAGLALGVVVVEAAERSGSLSTAGWAADLGREVMAVPGKATSLVSRGTHQLIRDGATLILGWEDVVGQLPEPWRRCVGDVPRAPAAPGDGPVVLDADAQAVLRAVGEEPVSIEDVIERSGVASGRAAAVLLTLELEGRVKQLAGKRFVRPGRG
jgi:DNA processing protein